jgi:hypothetical protein
MCFILYVGLTGIPGETKMKRMVKELFLNRVFQQGGYSERKTQERDALWR